MQHAICYISTAAKDFSDEEIQKLLAEWKENNSKHNIRGILLYSEGHFFQVLEGEKKNVLRLYEEIQQDSRHINLIQVLGKDIAQGSLDGYIVENLKSSYYSKPALIKMYCESVVGMDPKIQQQIKIMLGSFIDTRVL
jgi:hypothetical protein